jgi:hypothetical protein
MRQDAVNVSAPFMHREALLHDRTVQHNGLAGPVQLLAARMEPTQITGVSSSGLRENRGQFHDAAVGRALMTGAGGYWADGPYPEDLNLPPLDPGLQDEPFRLPAAGRSMASRLHGSKYNWVLDSSHDTL